MIKYSDYNKVFLVKNIIKFLKHIKINNYTNKLKKNKQLFFRLIYNWGLVELEILKTYIQTYLTNNFI